MKWMPISDELQQRPDLPRFAQCRAATKKCDSIRGTETKPLQKLLLGPHASLAQLARIDPDAAKSPKSREAAALRLLEERGEFPPKKVKPRQHRIFTAAAGLVRYAG